MKWWEFFNLLEEYCEQNFSEKLVEIVSMNNLIRKYGEESFEKKPIKEKEKLYSDMIDNVDSEFIKNGYQNLKNDTWNPLFIK